jgi:GTP pyrophosphokinase
MLNQLTQILFDENINIRSVEAHADERSLDTAVVEMTIDVRDKKQMEKVVGAMRRVSGVRDIERVY